ncbi:MAG: toxin glutamine deamidase domain-containing protein [Polyangiaceae bacterium]|nr:toxin glutamine deamidase domain-containing protein [Polyangiaceae bacterium]
MTWFDRASSCDSVRERFAEAKKIVNAIRNVNEVNEGIPYDNQANCAACAIAADATLGGNPTSALGGGPYEVMEILNLYLNQPFMTLERYSDIETIMMSAGPGARGIVIGKDAVGRAGHAFNVVNEGGVVVFVDAQTGRVAKLTSYKVLFLQRTN